MISRHNELFPVLAGRHTGPACECTAETAGVPVTEADGNLAQGYKGVFQITTGLFKTHPGDELTVFDPDSASLHCKVRTLIPILAAVEVIEG
jgi:hypothetical protein